MHSYRRRNVCLVAGALAVVLCAIRLHAQQLTGSIQLEVKDPSGAPMEVSGRLENRAANLDRRFQTDVRGVATLDGLSYGLYRLEISKEGFATQSVSITVRSAAPVSRAITMTIGAAAYAVDVVGTAPLPGVDRALEEVPFPMQTATDRDVEQSGALDLSDFLNRRLEGVYLNQIQGNPVQPDLNYRGYTASPLLGTPQGVSIYMDGVRLNQPFGDVVSWDLIPRIAIAEMTVIPGSNPLFGLNTLGGALALETKDGRRNPGTTLELSGGSFGRKIAEIQHGGSTARGLNWYAAGNLLFEDGWRAHSPSDVRQLFGKLGWQGAKTTLGLSFSYANNLLNGNGLQEQRFLARDYSSVYTWPDITGDRSPFLNFNARHSVGANVTFSANAFYRYIRANTINADLNENSFDQSVYQPTAADQAALTAAGYTGFPSSGANASNTPFPSWVCIAQALQLADPADECNGLFTRTHSAQHNGGLSGQVSWSASPKGRRNEFTAGAAYDRSNVDFEQAQQFAFLNPVLSFTAVNAFANGTTISGGTPYDTRVDLSGRIHTGSVYFTDTLSIGSALHLTASGRYNRTTIDNADSLMPLAGPGSLTGTSVFGRFNPAAGVTYSPARRVNAYFSYSEGSRAPTSIELGCADPNQPCKLPNAMAGDPPLDQVVTRTFEAGVRSGAESKLRWSAGWFRAENHNDILFVASTQTGFGYFKNFGVTRRQGAEANLSGRIGHFNLGGGYTFLDATYQSVETLNGSSNSANDSAGMVRGIDGNIQVQPGGRIPLIPEHMLKAFANWQATPKLSLDLGLIAISSSYARGDENNLHQPDGVYYLGPGTSPGYAVVNLGATYQVHRRVQLFVEIDNLLDRHYYTAAQLGPTGFTASNTFVAQPLPAVDGIFPIVHATFYAPGAPLGAFGGVRFSF
ncbi:MAG TPA: TonB-dependent receptor [Bryobacteraceae bacterium]|nr:TonB-dependent receptor [Bryobacteraceae bacterium]